MTDVPAGVREALERSRGETVTAARPRSPGANSEVWEVGTASGARYFVKRYPQSAPGEPDRLATERAALAFMARHGVREIPGVVCFLPAQRVGVFDFVDGRPLSPDEIGERHIRAAAAFLARLHRLRTAAGAGALAAAKEACFSMVAHADLVRGRVARLREKCPDAGLRLFLGDELIPHLERVASWIDASIGQDRDAELPPAARTLSPSDYGFHNALCRPNGSLVFIDFEYFGWDDPAKVVADFLLQPAVPVPERLRGSACRDLLAVYGTAASLGRRLPAVYALLAIKWCLIVLNVFVRRPQGPAGGQVRAERLLRARDMLGRARREFDARAFPFDGF